MARIRRKHDKFTLKQARQQLMMNRQHTYRQRLREWMSDPDWKNAPPLEGPAAPTEQEVNRICAALGCTCPGCEAARQVEREQAMVAQHETEEYGEGVLLDQSLLRGWSLLLDGKRRIQTNPTEIKDVQPDVTREE